MTAGNTRKNASRPGAFKLKFGNFTQGIPIVPGQGVIVLFMCGRYALFSLPQQIAARFGVVRVEDAGAAARPRFNISPGGDILVVRIARTGEREIAGVRWGFIPHWKRAVATSEPQRSPPINARFESVSTSPLFRDAFRQRRCLIPADAFYEWRSEPGRRGKQPMLIRRPDHALFAMAGVWDPSDQGETVAILTRPAVGTVRNIHERMPVILQESVWSAWLDASSESSGTAAQLLETVTDPDLESVPVSRRVNSPQVDDAACIRTETGEGPEVDPGLFGSAH
jgi:putative SOS response-associated peptidase YedK